MSPHANQNEKDKKKTHNDLVENHRLLQRAIVACSDEEHHQLRKHKQTERPEQQVARENR